MLSVFKEARKAAGIIHVCTDYGQGSAVEGRVEWELNLGVATPSVLTWAL